MAGGTGHVIRTLTSSHIGRRCGRLALATAPDHQHSGRDRDRKEHDGASRVTVAMHHHILADVASVRADHLPAAATGVERSATVVPMLKLIEFPADDPDRAKRFWSQVLAVPVDARDPDDGQGWQAKLGDVTLGLHERGSGPGDRFSLPYFAVADLPDALIRVTESGGEVIHPGERWAVCRDSEGSPFGLTQAPADAGLGQTSTSGVA